MIGVYALILPLLLRVICRYAKRWKNMSRDWVIDKFTINVANDSDVVKVKKDVKGVGATLLEHSHR
ncbi:hypothetical protein GHJ83_23395 [Sinorhizobium meliloti]|nr:hypothetical protein [Sinorhizobium meliloti]MQV62008.1 hypothetical protein [Sinorhizobium meliloti]